jgi:hypothetical protein
MMQYFFGTAISVATCVFLFSCKSDQSIPNTNAPSLEEARQALISFIARSEVPELKVRLDDLSGQPRPVSWVDDPARTAYGFGDYCIIYPSDRAWWLRVILADQIPRNYFGTIRQVQGHWIAEKSSERGDVGH